MQIVAQPICQFVFVEEGIEVESSCKFLLCSGTVSKLWRESASQDLND